MRAKDELVRFWARLDVDLGLKFALSAMTRTLLAPAECITRVRSLDGYLFSCLTFSAQKLSSSPIPGLMLPPRGHG